MTLPEKIDIKYVDFYDVPRCVVIVLDGRSFILESAFDPELS
jgi:hypothetical protein